jgi:uncharacterized protein VirK/YbjX
MSQSITLGAATAGLSGLQRLRERFKLRLRAGLHPAATNVWLQLLNSHPVLADLVRARPRLIFKIYRPYLSGTLDCARRTRLLAEHYRFILRQGLGPLSVRAARDPVPLGDVEGKSGLRYTVRLCAVDPMEREGELVLQLAQQDELVYSCAFSFFQGERGMVLGIGCMQGPKGERGLDLIRDATRELHGLRPKNLMIRMLSQIGHDHGCVELRLVGNGNRAVRSALGRGKVHADYDSFWRELGAARRADGDYQLACEALAAPDLALIASKKRAEARRRHETLVVLSAAVGASLGAPVSATSATASHDDATTRTAGATGATWCDAATRQAHGAHAAPETLDALDALDTLDALDDAMAHA